MATEELKRLVRIYKNLGSLAPLGANAILRRSLGVVASEINEVIGRNIVPLCVDPDHGHGSRPRPDPLSGLGGPDYPKSKDGDAPSVLSEFSAYREIRSEDRRRSVTLDPSELATGQLIDFYTGRTDSLEFRVSGDSIVSTLNSATENAKRHIRDSLHLVSTLSVAATSSEEIVDCLRSLAYVLEKRNGEDVLRRAQELSRIHGLGREICTHIGTEAGPTRWANNSTKLEQRCRDVYQCIDEDACCKNQAYTKHGAWEWRVVWEDTGNVGSPPPIQPLPFERYPWENRCPVFPSVVSGWVTSDWGWRTINGQLDFHAGMDIGVPVGTQVFAAVGGEIVHINRGSPNGETGVIIRTGHEIRQYWHIDPDVGISIGDMVQAGRPIGMTANIAAAHLHFARYSPPNGDWTKKADGNSISPCP